MYMYILYNVHVYYNYTCIMSTYCLAVYNALPAEMEECSQQWRMDQVQEAGTGNKHPEHYTYNIHIMYMYMYILCAQYRIRPSMDLRTLCATF